MVNERVVQFLESGEDETGELWAKVKWLHPQYQPQCVWNYEYRSVSLKYLYLTPGNIYSRPKHKDASLLDFHIIIALFQQSRHGKCHDHCDWRWCKIFQDWGNILLWIYAVLS